jgi:hypothetical protein
MELLLVFALISIVGFPFWHLERKPKRFLT